MIGVNFVLSVSVFVIVLKILIRVIYALLSQARKRLRNKIINSYQINDVQVRFLLCSGEKIYLENSKMELYVKMWIEKQSVWVSSLHDVKRQEFPCSSWEKAQECAIRAIEKYKASCYQYKVVEALRSGGFIVYYD